MQICGSNTLAYVWSLKHKVSRPQTQAYQVSQHTPRHPVSLFIPPPPTPTHTHTHTRPRSRSHSCRALADHIGRPAEPYLVPMMGLVLDRHADKTPAVRKAAEEAADALAEVLNPPSASLVLQVGMLCVPVCAHSCGQCALIAGHA